MADPVPTPAGARAHLIPDDADVDALERLWAVLERSHDAHAGLMLPGEDGLRPWCQVHESPALCGLVLELARIELYCRIKRAYAMQAAKDLVDAVAAERPLDGAS